eukprot:1813493-Pleurochrysis_carterae.AAC.3
MRRRMRTAEHPRTEHAHRFTENSLVADNPSLRASAFSNHIRVRVHQEPHQQTPTHALSTASQPRGGAPTRFTARPLGDGKSGSVRGAHAGTCTCERVHTRVCALARVRACKSGRASA